MLRRALPHHLHVEAGLADVTDARGRLGSDEQHNKPVDQGWAGQRVELADLVHLDAAAAGALGHQGLPQQGEVG